MRKAPKIMLITAATLIGTGTVLSCGAWAVAGFDTARLSTVNYDWHQTVSALENEADSPHKSIVITSEFENVLLEPADGDAIELEYWTGKLPECLRRGHGRRAQDRRRLATHGGRHDRPLPC